MMSLLHNANTAIAKPMLGAAGTHYEDNSEKTKIWSSYNSEALFYCNIPEHSAVLGH